MTFAWGGVHTIASMAGWIERYRAGDRVRVWTEMTSLGPAAREDAAWAEAVDVTRETMQRARANVERLAELLPEKGYRFHKDPEMPVYAPPAPGVVAELDGLEERIGRLPLALRCWFEEVGQANFVGEHPAWRYEYADPLVVTAPTDYVLSEYEDWEEADRDSEWDRGPFVVDLAPDYLHKADVSGGSPYGMAVPNEGVDGPFLEEGHKTTFVNYLRICFRWGGFPGWDAKIRRRSWASPPSPPPPLLAELAEALLPI